MRVLITGGTGFIGRRVVDEARRRGHRVHVLSHDLRNPNGLVDSLQGVEAVIHCAALMSGDLAAQRAVTVEGTRNLLAAMQGAGVKHILSVSTFALYDYHTIPANTRLDEDSPLAEDVDDLGPYVQTKRQQEDLVRERSIAGSWRWTIVRPGIVFGPDRMWFHHLGVQLSPTRWVCYAGDSALPLTYVENCAEAIVLALESEAAHGVAINLVDDDLPDRRTYMRELSRRIEAHPTIMYIPWSALNAAARSASWIHQAILFGRGRLPDLLRTASLDARCKPLRYTNARAKAVLGWTPRWNFEQGLARSLASGANG